MASGGHIMSQQRPNVESRIKGLVNQDLKEICKAYNFPVSGTKAVLQRRCITSEFKIYAVFALWEVRGGALEGRDAIGLCRETDAVHA